ncbi:MAG: glycosyltransferase family 2 protein, partial [Candidatus Omnitrophota bacterium]
MPFCIGFCMLTKREVIRKIGGLSSEYFPMFFEGTDYSMKVKKEGYLIGVAKGSYVYHIEHASFKQWPKEKERVFKHSREVFFRKWGRILRIAFILDDIKDVEEYLEELIDLTNRGNFLYVFTKRYIDREKFFKDRNMFEHSGINFAKYNSIFDLFWKVLKKKKKYDFIVIKNQSFINFFYLLKFIRNIEIVYIKDNLRKEKIYLKKKFNI